MQTKPTTLLTGHELAQRWGRSEAAISLFAAVGAGPRYVKIAGAVRFPLDEVQRFERLHATSICRSAPANAAQAVVDSENDGFCG